MSILTNGDTITDQKRGGRDDEVRTGMFSKFSDVLQRYRITVTVNVVEIWKNTSLSQNL